MSAPSLDQLSSRRLTGLLVLMSAALALVVGATSSLSVAQPDIGAALGATQTDLTWVVNAYALVFAAVLLPAGIAADRFGRRLALTGGLLVFGAASLASAWSGSPSHLIALRAVAGLGATFVMPATLSVLTDAFPEERRGFAVSVWAGVTGAGALLGVLLSGVLLHSLWWGSVQVVYGAAGLVLVPLVATLVPNHADPRLSLDPLGGVLAAVGLAALTWGVVEGPERGWRDGVVLGAVGVGALGLVAFVVAELRGRAPMLDVRLFGSPGLAAGSLLVLLLSLASFGFFLVGPQQLQFVRGYDALGAAVRLLPFALGIGPTSQLSPRLSQRCGPRWVAAVGAGTMAAGFALMAATADGAYWRFALCLVVLAAGFGLALTAGTELIIGGLPADRRTLASAVNDVTREVGGALGAAVVSSVLLTAYHAHVAGTADRLPAPAAGVVREGVAGALGVAGRLGPAGQQVAQVARDGFQRGFQAGLLVGAAVLLATAVLVGLLAPARAAAPEPVVEPVVEPALEPARDGAEERDARLVLGVGYPLLTAQQVVSALPHLEVHELEHVRAAEERHHGRVSVLRAVERQLRQRQPA